MATESRQQPHDDAELQQLRADNAVLAAENDLFSSEMQSAEQLIQSLSQQVQLLAQQLAGERFIELGLGTLLRSSSIRKVRFLLEPKNDQGKTPGGEGSYRVLLDEEQFFFPRESSIFEPHEGKPRERIEPIPDWVPLETMRARVMQILDPPKA